jgi:hypothetical protein
MVTAMLAQVILGAALVEHVWEHLGQSRAMAA